MITELTVNAAHGRKDRALVGVADALTALLQAKADLETLQVHYTNLGLEGTNDKARAAFLALKTQDEREAVAAAEAKLREEQLELDLANNDLARLRSLLQLLSVSPSDFGDGDDAGSAEELNRLAAELGAIDFEGMFSQDEEVLN